MAEPGLSFPSIADRIRRPGLKSETPEDVDIRNADPAEIEKFSKIADRWWDREGEFKSLHDINTLRLGYIHHHSDLKKKRVLDVGCGGGILSESMAAAGARVTGIDMGAAALEAARKHIRHGSLEIEYIQMSVEQFAQNQPARFDVIACMELLEHVPDPSSIVKACARLIKPGGDLFFATINRNPKSFLFAIIGGEYLLKLIPRGTHQFRRFIKPSELGAWGRNSGLVKIDFTGMNYNPFTKKFRLGGSPLVNYLMYFKKEVNHPATP
jgi:2-polyprenyl-6-hydroxyphenyl methylase/3-demethylubiquinone-9 3-methyltransferase